jgi:hypothetical protein
MAIIIPKHIFLAMETTLSQWLKIKEELDVNGLFTITNYFLL